MDTASPTKLVEHGVIYDKFMKYKSVEKGE
jgi:hypothetical protein